MHLRQLDLSDLGAVDLGKRNLNQPDVIAAVTRSEVCGVTHLAFRETPAVLEKVGAERHAFRLPESTCRAVPYVTVPLGLTVSKSNCSRRDDREIPSPAIKRSRPLCFSPRAWPSSWAVVRPFSFRSTLLNSTKQTLFTFRPTTSSLTVRMFQVK